MDVSEYFDVEVRKILNKNIKFRNISYNNYNPKNRARYRIYCKKYKKLLIKTIVEFQIKNDEAQNIFDNDLSLDELKIYYDCRKNNMCDEDINNKINEYRMMQTKTSARFLEYFYDIYGDLEDYKKLERRRFNVYM